MAREEIVKQGKILNEGGRVIIRLAGNFTFATVIILLIILGLGLVFLKNFGQPWATGKFSLSAFKEIYLSGERSLPILIPFLIGAGLTLFSIICLINILRKINKPKPIRAYIFDNSQQRFLLSMQPWNRKNPPNDLSRLPGYSYSQLSRFFVRSYVTTNPFYDRDSTIGSNYTQNYAVSLKKTDGGFWDLFDEDFEETAKLSVKELEKVVSLGGAENISIPAASPLTERIRRISSGGSVWYCWNSLVHASGSVQTMPFTAIIGLVLFFNYPKTFPFIIGPGLFLFIALVFLISILWRIMGKALNYQCIRMSAGSLQSGTVPKSVLSEAVNVASNQSSQDKKFKIKKQVDLKSVRHVQYNRTTYIDPQTHYFTFWTGKAGEAVDAMASSMGAASGSVSKTVKITENGQDINIALDSTEENMPGFKDLWKDLKTTSQMGKSIEQSNINITLEGLSIADAINFERVLEEEINRFGGHAD